MGKKRVRTVGFVILALFLILAGVSGALWYKLNAPAFSETFEKEARPLFIDDRSDYHSVASTLQSFSLKDPKFFDFLASHMKYTENIRTGKYLFSSGISNLELLRMLRNGNQTPVNVTFNNVRLNQDLAERVGSQLMFAPGELLKALNDQEVCRSFGFDTLTIGCMFIPNTYEIYWNVSVAQFMERMKKEYDRFWTPERLRKAEALSLTPVEVSVLASIVEEETAYRPEFPVVAGLYLNRLKKNMLLQADPTLKFAAGDVTLKRILFKHMEIESPYNTYKYPGLPPGPIRLPSIAGLDAVLNPANHNYLYMVAKEDFSGKHNFAVTLSQHNANARRYHAALNRAGIR